MALELFGFSIGRVDKDAKNKKSFALPEPEDGALEVAPTGGAMNSLFRCAVTSSKGAGMDATKFEYLCNAANLPGSTVEGATVNYMGRALNIPSNRAVQQLTTNVYNDEDMEIRNHIENWLELLSSHKTNKRASGMMGINSYTGTLEVQQLSKDGTKATKTYEFIQAYPASTGDIAVSWATNDIETFDIVWNFAYWTAKNSQGGQVTGSAG